MADLPGVLNVLSVWELTRSIRSLLEDEVGTVWVEGEISNYRRQSSGHQYFTLKDERSQLSCVLFRGNENLFTAPALQDGLHVQVCGQVTVYEQRGQYQMIVELVQARGVGALQARFEALKRKLAAEGLFAADRKRPLPTFPTTVGLVTSPTGAALQDMLNVLKRRAPWLRIVVYPVRVQGTGASLEIARAIRELNRWASHPEEGRPPGRPVVDLLVLARGGGSIEDLWEFNEEIVARAIAASALPVVSAVGHEIDFSIADFVADLRAPTPSAAAELIVPDTADLLRQLAAAAQIIRRRSADWLATARQDLADLAESRIAREPRRRLLEERQRIDALEDALRRVTDATMQRTRMLFEHANASLRLGDLRNALDGCRRILALRTENVQKLIRSRHESLSERLQATTNLLRVLGPEATLERGYTITTDASGQIIDAAANVRLGDRLMTRFRDGGVTSIVKE